MEGAGIDPFRRSNVERHLGREVDGAQNSNDGCRGGVVEVSVDEGRIWPVKGRAWSNKGSGQDLRSRPYLTVIRATAPGK